MSRLSVLLAVASLSLSASVHAHFVWINAFESHVHQPPHAMISLGWGHMLPMDDILNSPNGRIAIERFELIEPDLTRTELRKPEPKLAEPALSRPNFDLFVADPAVQKVALKKESAAGVYQFSAVSMPTFYTQFIDTKGRERLKLKPKDELADVEKVLMSVRYQAFAKAYLTVGEWTQPKPLGHGLEIIPRTDLSKLRVGDLVEVEVLFYGEPLNATAKSIEYITAHGSGFGQSDGFSLYSPVFDGKAKFRVQNAGQWKIQINHKDDVTPDGPLKELHGKAEQVYHGASLTFHVK